ncbi:MAG: preprotein translocase subunit SecY [Candidatus Nanohaloarchaeota archaeon QJJ-9]|nr:preprotein translocase subunit SecY [Candidatus Nanohaloarchaeota archaeon QJJ-9]
MSMIAQIANFLPSVKRPDRNISFKEKLTWTATILVLYFVMSEIYIFGASPAQLQQFQTFQTILGARIGTLVTLGIGPIVSASIILQLLTGSDIIPWDLNSSEGKAKFQNTQKLLAYLFGLFEAVAFVAMGAIKPAGTGLSTFGLVVGQLALGAWLIILMDEVVSKWGFHSGISLFILGGVSKTIVVRLISPLTSGGALWFAETGATPVGALLQFMTGVFSPSVISGLLFTVLVFAVAVYAQSMRVEIPLTFGNVRGFGRKWPLKFVYTSVIPVIFVSAIMSNLRLFASMVSQRGIELSFQLPFMEEAFYLVGQYAPNSSPAANQLIYYFTSPQNIPTLLWQSITTVSLQVPVATIIQAITYTATYIVGAAIFSLFWMETSGQDPHSVAEKIMNTGMKVPGFRKDKRVIVKILNRYIPALSILGGAFIGLLAAVANFTNAFGSGTGILLAVMISFQLYEEVVKKHLEDMHPSLRNFMSDMG